MRITSNNAPFVRVKKHPPTDAIREYISNIGEGRVAVPIKVGAFFLDCFTTFFAVAVVTPGDGHIHVEPFLKNQWQKDNYPGWLEENRESLMRDVRDCLWLVTLSRETHAE
jgi:hypothetical protein